MSRKSRRDEMFAEHERQNYMESQSVFYGRVPGIMPIAPPSCAIQLTPIVQPIALVPYSTQQQPICTMTDDDNYY